MRPRRQVRQGRPVKRTPLKFPDLAASYELTGIFHSFGGRAYTPWDSWRELDDKIVSASANSWLSSAKAENKERTLKRNFGVLGIAVICLSAKTRMRRLVPLVVRLVKGSWLA